MENYNNWLKLLKEKIRKAQIKSAVQVNSNLIALYWDIGKMIFEKQNSSDWGSKVIDKIAIDLKKEFPDTSGFSRTNLFSMRKFFLFYHNSELVHQLGGQLDDKSKKSDNQEDIIAHQVGGQLNVDVEYSLRDMNKPLGVSEYTFTELPEKFQKNLPTAKEINNELNKY